MSDASELAKPRTALERAWMQRNRQLANCPNVAAHTGGEPDGYNAWHDWAARMGKTHRQLKCDGCGLYAIWERRVSS